MKKTFLSWAVLLFALLLGLTAFPASAKYRKGGSVPLPLSVRIEKVGIPSGPDWLYDGEEHGITYDDTRMSTEGTLRSTDAGVFTAVFSLKDPVSCLWEDGTREPKSVSFRIVPRPVVLTSESDAKPWDGTDLTNGGYTLAPGKLPEGRFENVPEGTEYMAEALSEGDFLRSVSVTGFQRDAGTSPNVIGDARIFRADGRDVTGNYAIFYVYGDLTVEPVPIDLPEDASYKWNGAEQEIRFIEIADALSEASGAGYTVLDANGNDVTGSTAPAAYFDGTSAFRLYGTGAWNQKWSFRMTLKPDRNHYWSVPLHGETTDRRTVTLEILPELGNAKDVIIAGADNSMADGFSASGLAGLLSAPIISVGGLTDRLSAAELETIARLTSIEGARFWIMGGTGVVSSGIEAELRGKIGDPAYHVLSVQRITGLNRCSTSWHILECGLDPVVTGPSGWNESGTVIILPGGDVQPSLSIMTYAYATRTPVLLSNRGVLMDYTNDKDGDGVVETSVPAAEMLRAYGLRKAIIIGPESGTGSNYTSEACEAQLRSANPSVEIMRITGDSIGVLSNAICAWMESSSTGTCTDPNILRSGRYTYVPPEALPRMKDSKRVMSIQDYADLFKEIDVLGNAHLYVRTSAQFPYAYALVMTDGDQEGDTVLHGWMPDGSTGEVFFGNAGDSLLENLRPSDPEGYRFIGYGAPWNQSDWSYSDGILRMTLVDSNLAAPGGKTRQAVLYAVYVREGEDPYDPANYMRYKGGMSEGIYEKTLTSAKDLRIIVPRN
ncbi:MAG: cell wall-binding repeat-containing protein [Lachnospiraceae bacterium]|nr:cell wall-binding repeat-containing protein [Lachnospiraceae bacterium]